MATKSRLKERLGLVDTSEKPTPTVNVPPVDKAGTLVEAAESGFAAIQALYADRNRSVELAQALHRENVYLRNVNIGLREELQKARLERDYHLKLNSRLTAHVSQAYDIIGRVYSEIGQNALAIETIEPAQGPTNNPVVPGIDAIGLPVFDHGHQELDGSDGAEASLTPADAAELKRLAERLNGAAAS